MIYTLVFVQVYLKWCESQYSFAKKRITVYIIHIIYLHHTNYSLRHSQGIYSLFVIALQGIDAIRYTEYWEDVSVSMHYKSNMQ